MTDRPQTLQDSLKLAILYNAIVPIRASAATCSHLSNSNAAGKQNLLI